MAFRPERHLWGGHACFQSGTSKTPKALRSPASQGMREINQTQHRRLLTIAKREQHGTPREKPIVGEGPMMTEGETVRVALV